MAGKTASLQHVHRSLPDGNKGKMISLATGDDRTIFFDFLPVSALTVRGFVTKFQLYTVPGQVYYNMTRKLVLRGVDGVVFVADSQWERLKENVESFRNLEENLREYRLRPGRHALRDPVQQARPAQCGAGAVPRVHAQPARRRVPSFESVASRGAGVFDALNTVSRMVLLERVRTGTGGAPQCFVTWSSTRTRPLASRRSSAAFLEESGASEALLIDRSGQLLASTGKTATFDTVSISALAAGAFSSTGAIAELLGETEFSVLFHQGVRESIHVSTVDGETILLAIFDDGTTVGMVRLFAKEACRAIGAILAEARTQPRRVGALARPSPRTRRAGRIGPETR